MSARDNEVENILFPQEHYLVYLLAHLRIEAYPKDSKIRKLSSKALDLWAKKDLDVQSRRQAFEELLKAIDNISTVFEVFKTPSGKNHNAFVQAAKALKREGYAPLIQHLASHLAPITVHNTDKITYQVVPASQFNPHDPFQIEDHSQRADPQRAKNQTKREFDGVAAYTTVNSESMAGVKIEEFETKLSEKMDPVLVRFFMNNFHQDSLCDLLDRRGILGEFFRQHYGELFFDANVEKRGPDRYYDIESSQKEFVLTVKVVGRVGRCNDEPINVSLKTPVLLEAEMKFVFRLNSQNEIDVTRESFTCSAAPSFYIYGICLVEQLNENDAEQCQKIVEKFRLKKGRNFIAKGRNGIVLTNENKAYFIVDGKFILNENGSLKCVERIQRNGIRLVEKDEKPLVYDRISEISESGYQSEFRAIIVEALVKGKRLHFLIPPSSWFIHGAREAELRKDLEDKAEDLGRCENRRKNFEYLQAFLQSNNESAKIPLELINCLEVVDEAISQHRLNEVQVLGGQESPQLEKLEPAELIEFRKQKCAELMENAKRREDEAREEYEKIAVQFTEFRKLIENKAEAESPKEKGKEEARNFEDKGKREGKEEEGIIVEGDSPEAASLGEIWVIKRRLSISAIRSRFLASSAEASERNDYIPINESGQWVPPKALQKRTRKDMPSCCEAACLDWKNGKVLYGNAAPTPNDQGEQQERIRTALQFTSKELEEQQDIVAWSMYVQTELGLTSAQVEGLALTLSQELYDLHEALAVSGESELSRMPVLISRPDPNKNNIKIELVSKVDDRPLFETRFVLSVDELTNKKGQPKVAPISVFGTHKYIAQTFEEAAKAVQIRSYPGRMEKLHQVEEFLSDPLLQVGDHENPGEPSIELGRRLACEGKYQSQLFLEDGAKKEEWEQAFNESFGSVGTKEMPAADVLKASFHQIIADLPNHMGWTLTGRSGRLKGVQSAKVPVQSPGESACHSNLSAGGRGILNITGVSSSGFQLIWSPALDLDSDIHSSLSQIIPGEIFVTATKTVNGGIVESISYSNVLLRGLYEYAPIEKDGEWFYPELKMYGYTVVNEEGTINAEGLALASERAQEEEEIAQRHLELARGGFRICAIENTKLADILDLVEAHLISNKHQHLPATLNTAMATAIYRDLPLVLSGEKELEDCRLLLKTIVWCGVPELRTAMSQVLKQREEVEKKAEQGKGESEAAGIERAQSAAPPARRKGLGDLLAIYGSGDVAEYAQAYKESDNRYKKAAGRHWVNSAVANLERLKAEEAKAALKYQRSEKSLSDQIGGEIKDKIAEIREQEKKERANLTNEIERAIKSLEELKEGIPDPDQIEIGEAGASSPSPDTEKLLAQVQRKEKYVRNLQEKLEGLEGKFGNLRRIQEIREPKAEARAIIRQSKLEAARAQERVKAATAAAEIASGKVLEDFFLHRPNRLPVKLALNSCTLVPRIQKNKEGHLEDSGFDVVAVASGLSVTAVSDSGEEEEIFIPGKIVLKTRTAVGEEAKSPSFDIGVHHEFIDIFTPDPLLVKLLKYDTTSRDPELKVKVGEETFSIIEDRDKSRQLKKGPLEEASRILRDKEEKAQEKLEGERRLFGEHVESRNPLGVLEDPSAHPEGIKYGRLVAVQELIAQNETLDTEMALVIYHNLRVLLSGKYGEEDPQKLYSQLYGLIPSSAQSVCFTHEFQAKILRQILESAYVRENEILLRDVRRACVDHFLCTEQGRALSPLVEHEIRSNLTALKTQGEAIPGIDPDKIDDDVNQEVINYMDCIDRCTNPDLKNLLPDPFAPVTVRENWEDLKTACENQYISSNTKKWLSRILMGVGIIAGVGLLIGLGLATAGVGPAVIATVAGTVFAPSIPTLAASAFAVVSLGVGKLVGWSGDKDESRTKHVDAACQGMDKLLKEAARRAQKEAEHQKILASGPIEEEEVYVDVYGGEGCRGSVLSAVLEAEQEVEKKRVDSETSEMGEEETGFSSEGEFSSDDKRGGTRSETEPSSGSEDEDSPSARPRLSASLEVEPVALPHNSKTGSILGEIQPVSADKRLPTPPRSPVPQGELLSSSLETKPNVAPGLKPADVTTISDKLCAFHAKKHEGPSQVNKGENGSRPTSS